MKSHMLSLMSIVFFHSRVECCCRCFVLVNLNGWIRTGLFCLLSGNRFQIVAIQLVWFFLRWFRWIFACAYQKLCAIHSNQFHLHVCIAAFVAASVFLFTRAVFLSRVKTNWYSVVAFFLFFRCCCVSFSKTSTTTKKTKP